MVGLGGSGGRGVGSCRSGWWVGEVVGRGVGGGVCVGGVVGVGGRFE